MTIHQVPALTDKGMDLVDASMLTSLLYITSMAVKPVAGLLAESYHSALIDAVKEADFRYSAGRLTIHLAREFGFCYGVDRAVDYAYQARRRFPDRVVYLTGEIIHNPHVNDELRDQGIRFLSDQGESLEKLTPDEVVILPAFGVTIELLADLQGRGCTLVDTTCGSVLNVWKNVKRQVPARGDTSHGLAGPAHGRRPEWSLHRGTRP